MNGLILIASRVGITIVFPVEQLAATTIVNGKIDDDCVTLGKFKSEHVILTGDGPAKSDVYKV